jgi:hypothetical protein
MSKKDDLVPYYRPGTTEPEMVPRDSVQGQHATGYAAEVAAAEPMDAPTEEGGGVITGDKGKKSAKKAAKKK